MSLRNGAAVIGDGLIEGASITVSGEHISSLSQNDEPSGEIIDCSGLKLLPGLVDAHIHGAVGFDVNESDIDGLIAIARFLAGSGVTAWMPTLVPDSDENYRRVIAAIDQLMKMQAGQPIAQAVGVHYEGVFASEKMCGALRPEFFRPFTGTELTQLPRLTSGVHMMTFAPEIEGGDELAKELNKQGWIASIGHTSAGVETLDEAYSAGARHITHFFNAMTPMHHRDVGVVGWAFANRDVTFDIIADGVHVHPTILEFACRTKSPEQVSLISDSVAPTGLGDGEFDIWGEKVIVENGRTQNERGSIAGSVITMLDAVLRMRSLGFSDTEVSRMASLNPLKLLGLDRTHGSIAVGKRADLIAVDDKGNLKLAIVGGRIVHDTAA
ncbi:MAG: N-acetylglucosamine-6-phosphate deacetylase [Blastocatellia bacterium]|nr:N-acetylglucosamine-6-phosphate deacetylase [Blastocatellia bacterium]